MLSHLLKEINKNKVNVCVRRAFAVIFFSPGEFKKKEIKIKELHYRETFRKPQTFSVAIKAHCSLAEIQHDASMILPG